MTQRTADQAYKENTEAIHTTIKRLQAGLKDHAMEQAKEPRNYGYAGDAVHVLELLQRAVTFINSEED